MTGTADRARPVRAVFFDLGDTVWHFPDPPAMEAVTAELIRRVDALFAEWGAEAEAARVQRMLSMAWAEAEERAEAAVAAGPDYLAITADVTRALGLRLSEEQIARLWASQNTGGRFLGRVVLPDAVPTLEGLRARGLSLGVITNRRHGDEAFLAELDDYGLGDVFDTVVSSDQVGYRKPHRRIFEIALDRIGVEAGEAVHVGDRLIADVAGARRAGLYAVWMRGVRRGESSGGDGDARPHHTIDRLSELLTLPSLR